MAQAGFEFRISPVKVSEKIGENLNPEIVATQLAADKVRACLDQYKELKSRGFLILGADTIVVVGDKILGKPETTTHAKQYLRLLSSKTHRVITGLCLVEPGSPSGGLNEMKFWSGAEETHVTFRALTDREIDEYVSMGEPMDKAGAYAIQGEGGKFVSSFRGSWSNVVGLPLERLEKTLKENEWDVRRRPLEKT